MKNRAHPRIYIIDGKQTLLFKLYLTKIEHFVLKLEM